MSDATKSNANGSTVHIPIIRSFIMLLGLYLGLNSILAIPLIDEDKTKIRELSLSLRDDLNRIKGSFLDHMMEIKYDSSTLSRFDSINRIIGYSNTATSLQNNFNYKVLQQKMIFENQVDIFYYDFLNKELAGLNSEKKYRNKLLQAFKKGCDTAETEIFNNTRAIRANVLELFNIARHDTSKSHEISKNEFSKLLPFLSSMPIVPMLPSDKEEGNPFLRFFFLVKFVVKDESQILALIYGLIGLGLLGAVIGNSRRDNSESDQSAGTASGKSGIANTLFSAVVKSFSASVISYLSIKGGLSIVSDQNDVNPNPYFVLFVCFVAAVYSEDIWQWAKKKIFPT